MTNVRSLTISAAAALLLVAGAACADSKGGPPSTTPSSSSPSTPSSTPPTQSEAAAESASAALRRYFAVLNELRQQPGRPLSELSKVATSLQLSSQRTFLQGERRKGLRQVGDTRISDLKVQSVNLDNSDPKAGKVPTAVVDVCWDVSRADLVDGTGKSVVSPNRSDIGWTRYTVANYHWDSNPAGGWRIASGQDLEKTPCAAS